MKNRFYIAKKLAVLFATAILCVSQFSTVVFAYVDESWGICDKNGNELKHGWNCFIYDDLGKGKNDFDDLPDEHTDGEIRCTTNTDKDEFSVPQGKRFTLELNELIFFEDIGNDEYVEYKDFAEIAKFKPRIEWYRSTINNKDDGNFEDEDNNDGNFEGSFEGADIDTGDIGDFEGGDDNNRPAMEFTKVKESQINDKSDLQYTVDACREEDYGIYHSRIYATVGGKELHFLAMRFKVKPGNGYSISLPEEKDLEIGVPHPYKPECKDYEGNPVDVDRFVIYRDSGDSDGGLRFSKYDFEPGEDVTITRTQGDSSWIYIEAYKADKVIARESTRLNYSDWMDGDYEYKTPPEEYWNGGISINKDFELDITIRHEPVDEQIITYNPIVYFGYKRDCNQYMLEDSDCKKMDPKYYELSEDGTKLRITKENLKLLYDVAQKNKDDEYVYKIGFFDNITINGHNLSLYPVFYNFAEPEEIAPDPDAGNKPGPGSGDIPAPVEPEKKPIISTGTDADKNPVTNVNIKDNVKSDNEKAEAVIDKTTGDSIVDKANTDKSKDIIIDAKTEKEDINSFAVNFSETTFKDISEKTEAGVTIKTDNGTISFDKKAVDSIASQTGTDGDVKMSVKVLGSKLNIIMLELKVETSNGAVGDFNGGTATVTVPVSKDLYTKNVVCVYIDSNGRIIMVGGLRNDDGTFTFTTNHFSTYAIMPVDEAEAAIKAQDVSNAEISGIVDKTYTGKVITQDVVVKLGDKTLAEGTDYEVAYENNKNVGFGSVKIAGKGKYDGEITKTFKINPKGVSLTSVKAQKKALKATWKTSANKVSGYQVRYSTSSKFKTCKTVGVKYTKKINSRVIKKLKANKRYYVKVRTYTKTIGGTCYSDWSKVKSVKVK